MNRSQQGYSMVALLAAMTVMTIAMSVGVSGWKYVMKDTREEELIFRGSQIAAAVKAYQAKNGNTYPPSLDVLVKGKFLRKAFKDPMTPDGKWRFLRPGEGGVAPGQGGVAGVKPSPAATSPVDAPSPPPGPRSGTGPGTGGRGGTVGGEIGLIAGVASRSTDESLRIVNGRTHYNEWLFIPGQPIVIGQAQTIPGGGIKPPKR